MNIRQKSEDNSLHKTKGKKVKEKDNVVCSICEKNIVESNDEVDGDDAVYCERDCKAWLHRKCVGMTKIVYDRLSNCEDPYLCPNCIIVKQSKEIAELSKAVKNLTRELAGMKALEQRVIDPEKGSPLQRNLPVHLSLL